MKYFCPIYGKSFDYFSDDSSYGGNQSSSNIQADAADQTIIDKWNTVPVPPAPELKPVTIDPKTTALLILDMETSICKSPRCIASIPNINNLLVRARKNNMLVVYSLIPMGNPSDIFKQLTPLRGDPIVKSTVDKFYKTNLEKILQKKGIKTVIVTGYAANGAVLHTATAAAFRDYNVIVPVDGMSANDPYAEQYTAWHMLNSPGTRGRVTLTKSNLISF
ncbi:cysteine hydrolase [Clostridium sp. OS1-26]|uniref:cysteine hydrolase n=1 Tax=Clostridium sp. OS1-26 TaxID=3070681 RepID=UPI0027DFE997|nr:cysteine hydrolase [Clostridium sp. OS1-26]WML33373.1 cysteine hydrolase [Clostridium sp. OS1-26]